MPVDLRHLDLPVGLVPSADKVHTDMTRTGYDQEPEKLSVFHSTFDAVEDIFSEIYEKENIEDLFYGVLDKRERQKKPIGIPHLL